MRDHPFTQIDVFAPRAYTGNPLAVVHDADDVPAGTMQQFANWTGLSETTFLLEPTDPAADFRVRSVTGGEELPFAGHPTLGSAFAWLQSGGVLREAGVVVQECGAGLVRVRRDGERLAFAAPPLTRFEPVEEELVLRLAAGLGVDRTEVLGASWLVNGPRWIGVRLADAARVLGLQPDGRLLDGLEVGVVGAHPAGSEADFEVRAFIVDGETVEDPVTGSLNAGLAHWLISEGHAPSSYVAAQGTALGRSGRVHVAQADGVLWVGGEVVPAVRGVVRL